MSVYRFFLLHGFLGSPRDWDPVIRSLQSKKGWGLNLRFTAIDLFDERLVASGIGFEGWAKNFNRLTSGQNTDEKRVLLGYSLGARLGLHALLADQSIWNFAIFVSGHPGLPDESDRLRRRQADELMAERFEKDPWDELIQFWNSRDVFCGSPSPFVRSEKDHHREQLAFALRNWSLGRQKDLSCDLSQIIPPVLWIAGEHDRRFVELGHDIQRIAANINFVAVRGAAHRVPWENTREFTEELLKFLRRT